MKRKTITLVIYMLVCISLVSVGFAAWVITGGTSTSTTGGIEASAVADKSLKIENLTWIATGTHENGDTEADYKQIIFGRPEDSTLADAEWLGWDVDVEQNNKPGVDEAQLNAKCQFELSVAEGVLKDAFQAEGSSIKFDIAKEFEDELTAATKAQTDGKNYINAPTLVCYIGGSKVGSNGTVDELFDLLENSSETRVTIVIEVLFTWGSKTGGANPFTYYNSLETPTQEQKQEAYDLLNTVFSLNGASYTLSIDLKGKAFD